MAKDVEDVNLTRKSKKRNKADKRATEIGKGRYFEEKVIKIQPRKHVLGVRGSYPYTEQCPVINVHFERVCRH